MLETATTEQFTTAARGAIKEMGVLNLLGMTTPDDLAGITSIEKVGVILISETLIGSLMAVCMTQVGSVVPVPPGDDVKVITGQMRTTGDALANIGGDADDTLVIVGQLILTTKVERVGYKKLIVTGQVLAPQGSESALSNGLTRLVGQVVYYPPNTRIIFGNEHLTADFFALLDEPISLCIFGNVTIEASVPVTALKTKLKSIMLFGKLTAPRALVPMLQILTTENFGNIISEEDSTAGDEQ